MTERRLKEKNLLFTMIPIPKAYLFILASQLGEQKEQICARQARPGMLANLVSSRLQEVVNSV